MAKRSYSHIVGTHTVCVLYVCEGVASGSDYLVIAKLLACPVYSLIFFAQMYAVGTCLQADIALQMKAHGMYLPTYAIGGITAADAGSIAECGIHGVAISSAILGSNDFEGCTKEILNALSDNQ